MQLLDLPSELLGLCCDQLIRCPDVLDEWGEIEATSAHIRQTNLKALRLTCKQLEHIATTRLFADLYLLPTNESAKKLRHILEDQRLSQLVYSLSIRASLECDSGEKETLAASWDCEDEDDPEWDNVEDDEHHAIDSTGEVSAAFKKLLEAIGLFPKLRCIEIIYDHQVSGPSESHMGFNDDARESMEYRDTFFRKVLSALNHPDHPVRNLRTLSIVNLQDKVNVDIATSPDFEAVLSRLESLNLCIASETHEPAPEHAIDIQERHDFYSRDLQRYWLEPLQDFGRLTKLKLYGSIPWGYLPACDLRGFHFPKLTSLCLGHMTFTHDWQLDWILSHGSTLRSLILDNCPIIADADIDYKLDTKGYPILDHRRGTSRGRRHVTTWVYQSRWHEYFEKFRTDLPHLRHFATGHGPWDYCCGNDQVSSAFADAESLHLQLIAGRYCFLSRYVLIATSSKTRN